MFSRRKTRPNRHRPQDEIRTLISEVGNLVDGLDRATFNRRPVGGGWSVGECVDHLSATARLYLPVLTEAIEKSRKKAHTGTRHQGRTWLGRLLVWSQEPPPRRWTKMRTWPEVEPERDLDPTATLDEFVALHEELIVRMNETGDLDLRKVRVSSALDSRLRLSLGDWFAFLAAHGRRHLWQARQALEEVRTDGGAAPRVEETRPVDGDDQEPHQA